MSSAAAFWLVTLDCITMINYSNFYFSTSLPRILYSTDFLSFPPLPQTLPLYLASCTVTAMTYLSVFASSSTALFTLFNLFISHWFSHALFRLLFSLWMTWLPYPASCSFTSCFRNKHGSGFCVGNATVIWWAVGGVVLRAAPDAWNYTIHTEAPSLPQTACSCHWKTGISYSSVGVSSRAACTKLYYITAVSARQNPAQCCLLNTILDTFE